MSRLDRQRSLLSPLVSSALVAAAAIAGAVGCGDTPCDPDAPGTICTLVGNGEQGFGGEAGLATEARFNNPMDMAVAPDGTLWILDFNNYVIRALHADGTIHTVAGNGFLGDSPPVDQTRIPCLEASFNHTPDLFFHDGHAYLAAWHNTRVKRIDLAAMELENYAGIGRRLRYDGDGGPALAAAVDLPSGVTADPDGNIVFMDQANQVIRKVDPEGNISRVAGTCVVDFIPCAEGEAPVACPGSNKTVCGPPETECVRECVPGFGGDGGPALEARLGQEFGQKADPSGRLTYDAAGNLYFADTENHRVRRVGTDGIITTIAGTGKAGFEGEGGPATEAKLFRPIDVEAAPDGSIYFTDVGNSCVRKIDPAGIITTVVGRCTPSLSDRPGDGPGFAGDGGAPTDALLNWPYGIELAGDKLYVADTYNNRVRVVNL
jgi:DNA-binding beta-propeller fold protein YncE